MSTDTREPWVVRHQIASTQKWLFLTELVIVIKPVSTEVAIVNLSGQVPFTLHCIYRG